MNSTNEIPQEKSRISARRVEFLHDYGMIFVLLLLCVIFSALTLKQQHPTGAAAGKQVAEKIVRSNPAANVMIVGRDISEDREFADAARKRFESANITVVAIVNGGPGDVRAAIEKTIEEGHTIDRIAANDVTARWSVYDRFDNVGADKLVVPQSYRWPDFLKSSNLLGVATQTAIYAIIAIGMTMVIVTGGIDLGVGSLVALAAVTAAILIRQTGGVEAGVVQVVCASTAGVSLCAFVGCFVGLMVTRFQLPSFIVTLAVMMMAKGLALQITNGESVSSLPTSFFWLGGRSTLGVPNPVWIMIGLYVIAHVVMSRTVFGRYIYAIGGNKEAARLSGVPVKRTLVAVYAICGGLAGLGGVILASQLAAGDPKFGDMYELYVIAAVVVGGTSLMGGRGKIFGTLIGAFIIAVIKNGMNLTNVAPFSQLIVLGAVLLLAVLLDRLNRGES